MYLLPWWFSTERPGPAIGWLMVGFGASTVVSYLLLQGLAATRPFVWMALAATIPFFWGEVNEVTIRGQAITGTYANNGKSKATGPEFGEPVYNRLAPLLAARHNKERVEMTDFEAARSKVRLGPERRSLYMPEPVKKTAYHEAGHAIVAPPMARTLRHAALSRCRSSWAAWQTLDREDLGVRRCLQTVTPPAAH